MNRYTGTSILKDSYGKRYLKGVKYPQIEPSDGDIYIIAGFGEAIDVLAYDYYKSVDDWWIIAVANNLPGDSRYIKPGTQIRIPRDAETIRRDFNDLNGVI